MPEREHFVSLLDGPQQLVMDVHAVPPPPPLAKTSEAGTTPGNVLRARTYENLAPSRPRPT